ncbi:unnamed protein product [Rangifer tarandus platyrhynchus]|uniref:Uncharacterized protein n=1 Tax=Rangifer tarandus platyrhynchus TaxID=3082113 RepID=A0AC59Y4S0_RANTA
MEFMASDSLEKMLSTHSLSWQLKIHTVDETSLAMNFLHSIKPPLLHLYLKPGSILLDSCTHVKVSDFGLSKRMEQSTQMQCIKRSALQGTLSCIPLRCSWRLTRIQGPNRTRTGSHSGHTCSVCSFGVVIWEILTQKKPHSGSSGKELACQCRRHMRSGVDPWARKFSWRRTWQPTPIFLPGESHGQRILRRQTCCFHCSRVRWPTVRARPWPEGVLRSGPARGGALRRLFEAGSATLGWTVRAWSLVMSRSASMRTSSPPPPLPGRLGPPGGAQNGDDHSAHLLLDQGARVDAQEHEGWTPLHLAAQNNSENVAWLLVSHQADPNLREAEGKTPLHVAAYFGHVGLVKLPAVQGAELDGRQRNLRTPLHLAVEGGKGRAIQHLLKSGVAPGALDQSSYSPLHTATARGKYLVCKMLLRHGANLELLTQQGWTPLHLAAYKGHLEIIHLLAESQADVGAPGGMNWTAPLHLAARHGAEVVVSTLLKCGADPNAAEQSGWMPLHLAVQTGAFLSIIHLLEYRVEVHAHNKVGWNPAHLATLKGNMAILRVPVKAGAQLDIQEGVGCTPLQLTLWSQKQGIITFPEGREPSLAILGEAEPGAQMEV